MTDSIPVPYGLTMTPMPDGRHIFRPADGVDVLEGGKAEHLSPPPGDLYAPPIVPTPTVWTGVPATPVVPGLPELPVYPNPCCVTRPPPDLPVAPPPAVPLSESVVFLLLAAGMLAALRLASQRGAP